MSLGPGQQTQHYNLCPVLEALKLVFNYKSKGYFNAAVLEAFTQQCGLIPVRFDTLKSNLNKLYYASAKCLLQ